MKKSSPTLIIFAGANGSGKTTAAKYLLPKLKIKEFVNADEISFEVFDNELFKNFAMKYKEARDDH